MIRSEIVRRAAGKSLRSSTNPLKFKTKKFIIAAPEKKIDEENIELERTTMV
jgi:hypothetical protein